MAYAMNENQMSDWKKICQAYAKKQNAKLLFVNNSSCGLEYPDGSFSHVTVDDMLSELTGAK